ncbi:Protein CYP-33C9 [Aphelenchoides avenae]|nr:Protein CYP-33C9 [Aphelenchus avenae]
MLLTVGLALVVYYIYWNFYEKRRRLPPGPTPLPLIGNLLELSKCPPGEDKFIEWRKRYGDVYTYWNGEEPIVSIAEIGKIQEAFVKDADSCAGRPMNSVMDDFIRGAYGGVIFSEGNLWRDMRRFALHVFRNFGLGKNLMHEKACTSILDEVTSLVDDVKHDIASGVKRHEIAEHIDVAIGSVVNSLVFGYRFRGERRSEFFDLKRKVAAHIRCFGHPLMMMINNFRYASFMGRIPPVKGAADLIRSTARAMFDFFERQIEEHKAEIDLDPHAEPRDYVEAYFKEQAKREASGEPHFFTHQQLKIMCYDLWVAGQETTSNTLAWAMVFALNHPEHQEKLHAELDRVIGCDRIITTADRPNLPYTNAFINEAQRMANLIPQNVLHKTTRDVTIDGYLIPVGTTIVPQISAILYDERIFKEPKTFNPDRFIDDDGNLKKADELIPFSIGKRQCLGEGLARMELFLFIANIFNQFKTVARDNDPRIHCVEMLPGYVP